VHDYINFCEARFSFAERIFDKLLNPSTSKLLKQKNNNETILYHLNNQPHTMQVSQTMRELIAGSADKHKIGRNFPVFA
jgi:hypothetical protein